MGIRLISSFGQNYTVTRYSAGRYVRGIYQEGAKTTFTAMMSIQPVTGEERLELPEGQRSKCVLKGYSAVELFTVDQSPSKKADEVEYDGAVFEVVTTQQYSPTDIKHWKVILVRKNP